MACGMDPGPDPIGELVADERRGGELLIARFLLAMLLAFVPALFALRFFTG